MTGRCSNQIELPVCRREAFYLDFQKLVEEKRDGKLSTQLNYTKNGFKSILKKLRRKAKNFEEGNYKDQIMAVHKRWADV